MRKTLDQIMQIVNGLKIGGTITVLTPNGTMHAGAAHYYRRKGLFNGIETDKDGTKLLTILVGKSKRKYKFRLKNDYDRVNGEIVYNDHCYDILDIIVW